MNPSLNYEIGLLIEGFDDHPTFMMTYNPPYYEQLIEGYGFKKSHDLYSYLGCTTISIIKFTRVGPLVEGVHRTFNLKTRPLDRSRFDEDVRMFLDIYNKSCLACLGLCAHHQAEMDWMAKDMKHIIVPELTCVAEVDGKPVAAVFGLPDYNPRIKAINGRLFPFGFFKLLSKKRDIPRVRLISTNVIPEYQKWGLGVCAGESDSQGLAMGMLEAEFSWVSEANTLARQAWKKEAPRRTKSTGCTTIRRRRLRRR